MAFAIIYFFANLYQFQLNRTAYRRTNKKPALSNLSADFIFNLPGPLHSYLRINHITFAYTCSDYILNNEPVAPSVGGVLPKCW